MRREQLMKGWISTTDELVAHFLYISFFAVALLLKDQVKEMRGNMHASSMPEDVAEHYFPTFARGCKDLP